MRDHYLMTIGGRDVDAASRIEVLNPATETVLGTVADAGSTELDLAVKAAHDALHFWNIRPYTERQKLVAHIGETIEAHANELIPLLTCEQGKPTEQARFEILGAAAWCKATASLELPLRVLEDSATRRAEIRREPIGVVGAISPWNFPVMLSIWKIAPALLAGNTVVLKPSPFTPLTMLRIGALLRDLLPPGALNVVSGGDALGPLMSAHPGFDKISFTGSTATGRCVMAAAAPSLKRLTLELGGNDAAIVFPDVDVAETAKSLFWSAFTNSGQVCVATKRAYIHEDVYQPFLDELTKVAHETTLGNGTEPGIALGPLQNRRQYDRVRGIVADCRERGQRVIEGRQSATEKGYFVPVTLIDNPPDSSRIVREEQFGPVLPLLRFSQEDDVVRRVNDSEYGLAATIWTSDTERALRVAARLETGNVWINEALALSPFAAFGGRKQSGFGVENGLEGLVEYTTAKSISLAK
jgi:acyl-CoA reductase-like NAD-dependent aldehyde dehydrogenase